MHLAAPLSLGRRSLLALLVLIVAFPAVAQASAPTVTVRKVALGVSQNPDTSLAALDAFKTSVRRMPAIWSIWSAWGGANAAFPDKTFMNGLRSRGVVPQVFWEPVNPANNASVDDPTYNYRSITDGKHDAYIRKWAKDAKRWGGTVLLKFAHEMNAAWFPWGIGRSGNTVKDFKAAWRRIHDLVRGPGGENATNVQLVWSVYGECGCPSHASLYPGDAYVEYVGFSSFDWGGNRSMKQIFAGPVKSLQAFTSKKIIVTETATPANPGDKRAWIAQGYPAVYKAFPRIAAIVYFNVFVPEQPDWRLTEPVAAQSAYASIVAQARFQGRIP